MFLSTTICLALYWVLGIKKCKVVFSVIGPCLLVILTHPLTRRQVARGSEVSVRGQRPSLFCIFYVSEAETSGLVLSFTSVAKICYQAHTQKA